MIVPILAGLLGASLTAISRVQADDSDQAPQVFPNRIQATPPPRQTPRFHVIGIPNQEGAPGAPLSPDAGSQMGVGIQLHFGGSSEPQPRPHVSPSPKKPGKNPKKNPGN